ncbi:putative DNA repair protein RecN [Bacteriovorax sp. BSW11_IV]|uniref:DNA repair protein RecN n=1 Tax=Bacteriovorax sp. BSW11_IV TaxID=1353529 RepID=UPI00038A4C67|nr:DNA repair protein RecN [Bacteriovorax sp. BSW11_IV]EQC44849.1 putative DNA repair protein RecN [Bacteriovorax sp. BSW11_IV]
MPKQAKLLLNSLSIKNFATFEDQTIHFDNCFNSIIGETGSGKSLILEAIQLILGARSDKKIVRKGSDFATIEATFDGLDTHSKKYFDKLGFPTEDQIVVKRIIYSTGKSKSFLNFETCSLSILQQVSKYFVDLVGQFENQKLLSTDYQLQLLDSYIGNDNIVGEFNYLFEKYNSLIKKRDSLQDQEKNRLQREDFLKYQIAEILNLDPSVEEEKELLKKKESIVNFEKNHKSLIAINDLLCEGEINISDLISRCKSFAHNLDEKFYNAFEEISGLVEQTSYDVSKELSADQSEEDIDSIMEKLDQYQKLKRKYGNSIESTLEYLSQYQIELAQIHEFEASLDKINADIEETKNKAYNLAKVLHSQRVTGASKLSKELTTSVRSLMMKGATFKIKCNETSDLTASGITSLEFNAETNPGEGFHNIKDIASGGELSRILLSLRKILSTNDSISVFLFDEIDTGVGGETAMAIGKALAEVASKSQVIAITHLPQIAFFSDKLIHVSKKTENKRTFSCVEEITGNSKKQFIASMTPISLS